MLHLEKISAQRPGLLLFVAGSEKKDDYLIQLAKRILHESRGSESLFRNKLSKEWSRRRGRPSEKIANFEDGGV